MSPVKFEKIIENHTLRVIFILDEYTEKKFYEDIEYIKNYQDKKDIPEDPQERAKFLDFKFYKNVPWEKITYRFFINQCFATFSDIFFDIMKDRGARTLLTSYEYNLQFRLKRVKDGSYYFSYNEEDNPSDAENACFYAAGLWLINNVALPLSVGRADYTIIRRFVLHELAHHKDFVEKNNHYEREDVWEMKDGKFIKVRYYDEKFKRKALLYRNTSGHFLNCMYTSLFNLREEGIADFYARSANPFDMNLAAIKEYNKNMQILSTLTRKKIADQFWDKKISTGNLTPTGEYVMGRNCIMTIAMALSHQKNKQYIINVDKVPLSSRQITLREALDSGKTIFISGIDKQIINETLSIVKPLGHYYFVKKYEEACDILSLPDEYRIMTRERFYTLIRHAIYNLKYDKTNRLAKKGFLYFEQDLTEMGRS